MEKKLYLALLLGSSGAPLYWFGFGPGLGLDPNTLGTLSGTRDESVRTQGDLLLDYCHWCQRRMDEVVGNIIVVIDVKMECYDDGCHVRNRCVAINDMVSTLDGLNAFQDN